MSTAKIDSLPSLATIRTDFDFISDREEYAIFFASKLDDGRSVRSFLFPDFFD